MSLLSEHIKTLHLRRDAPFPSEAKDAHEAVRNWRHEQRIKLVRRGDDSRAWRDPDSLSPLHMDDQ